MFLKQTKKEGPDALVMVYSDGRRADIKTKSKSWWRATITIGMFKKFVDNGGLNGVKPGRYYFTHTKRRLKIEGELTPVEE